MIMRTFISAAYKRRGRRKTFKPEERDDDEVSFFLEVDDYKVILHIIYFITSQFPYTATITLVLWHHEVLPMIIVMWLSNYSQCCFNHPSYLFSTRRSLYP